MAVSMVAVLALCAAALMAPAATKEEPPAKATAELIADQRNPLLYALKVTALDANGNCVPAKGVVLNVTGGKPDVESGVTDAKGEFTTDLTWDQSATDRRAVAVIGDVRAEARVK
jgi:hypothetical protein